MEANHEMSVYISLGKDRAIGISSEEKELVVYDMKNNVILAKLGEATMDNIGRLMYAANRLSIHATDAWREGN